MPLDTSRFACWYIYSAGEPDRPVVICDLKAELPLTGRPGRAWIAGHARI